MPYKCIIWTRHCFIFLPALTPVYFILPQRLGMSDPCQTLHHLMTLWCQRIRSCTHQFHSSRRTVQWEEPTDLQRTLLLYLCWVPNCPALLHKLLPNLSPLWDPWSYVTSKFQVHDMYILSQNMVLISKCIGATELSYKAQHGSFIYLFFFRILWTWNFKLNIS